MTKDAEYLHAAIDLAVDRVLYDPTDSQIVLAVEEWIGPIPTTSHGDWLRRGVLSAYERTERSLEGRDNVPTEDRKAIVKAVQSVFGLN